jgi:hypothetical protein
MRLPRLGRMSDRESVGLAAEFACLIKIVIDLPRPGSLAWQREGACPAQAKPVFQVFSVDNDEVVEIRCLPGPGALART